MSENLEILRKLKENGLLHDKDQCKILSIIKDMEVVQAEEIKADMSNIRLNIERNGLLGLI